MSIQSPAFGLRQLLGSAAMVFEEAARLSHQYGQRWTMASALTSKAPAHSKFSHSDAQAHRLPNEIESATLSHV